MNILAEDKINPRVGVVTQGRIDVWRVNPDDLILDPEERGRISEPSLDDLVESIRNVGQIEPIAIRKGMDDKVHVVAGFSRVLAIKRLKEEEPDKGWTVLARLLPATNDAKGFALALAENIVRNNLTQLEAARGVGRLRSIYNWSAEEVSKALGRTEVWVYSMEKILSLPEDLQQSIHRREVSVDAAFVLSNRDDRKEIIQECLSKIGYVENGTHGEIGSPAISPKISPKVSKPKSDKQAKVTKKAVAEAVNKRAAKESGEKHVPPTLAGFKKIINNMDSLGWIRVEKLQLFLEGATGEDVFSDSIEFFEVEEN